MKTIEQIINNEFFAYTQARKPRNWNKPEPPPDEPWSTSEVRGLINIIVHKCNSELAALMINKD